MEKAEYTLRNLYAAYKLQTRSKSLTKLNRVDKLRWLGGLEALLKCVGKLQSGIDFDYKKTKKVFLKLIPYTSTESYEDYILRNCYEFITAKK